MLGNDIKELVRSRTDLAGLIGESHGLIAKGPNYTCLCPFHDDHNPSMMVYPDRQSFRCWSCNEGGDAFAWVMKRDGVGFFDALKILAERAGIDLPKSQYQSAEHQKKTDLFDVLKWAESQLHEYFMTAPEAQVAREYVAQRGYTAETIARFRIGYHPPEWEWFLKRAAGQFDAEVLLQARLIKQRPKAETYYDYFVDRVVFPIHDERGRTVAFGGRIIPGRASKDAPKYFNSPESDVFSKSRILYGLPEARESISHEKSVIVVEGYADCVACHQHGVKNVVATLGTALTEQQCERLKSFAPKVVLVYDSDEAGQNAAAKSVGMLIGIGVDLRVVTLPTGKDPDEFLRANGTDAFRAICDTAPEAWEFRLNWEIAKRGSDAMSSQEAVLVELLKIVAQTRSLTGSVKESLILARLAARLAVPLPEIRGQLGRLRGDAKPERQLSSKQSETITRDDMLESAVLEIMLTDAKFTEDIRQRIGPDDFSNAGMRRLYESIGDCCEIGIEPTFDAVMAFGEDPALKSLAVVVSDRGREKRLSDKLIGDAPAVVRQSVDAIINRREAAQHRELIERTALSGNADPADLLRKATAFHRRRTRVAVEI